MNDPAEPGDPLGRYATWITRARDLSASAFRAQLLRGAIPLLVGVLGTGVVGQLSLSKNARAIASAPFGLFTTVGALAIGVILLGRYVRIGVARYRVAAAVSVFFLCFIVFTGSFVRLTGSGLGCKEWPSCNEGEFIASGGKHAQIEFGNRMVTYACILAAGVCVLLAFVRRPYRRDLVALGSLLCFAIFSNAIVGGLLVLFELKTMFITGHFIVAIVALAIGLNILFRNDEPGNGAGLRSHRLPTVSAPTLMLGRIMTGLVIAAMFFGTIATGSGPHSGDPESTERYPFDLERVAMLHSAVVWLGIAATVLFALRVAREPGAAEQRRRTTVLLGALVAQGAIGYLQWFTKLPWGLVQIHVVGAVLVFCVLMWVYQSLSAPVPRSAQLGTRASDPVLSERSDLLSSR